MAKVFTKSYHVTLCLLAVMAFYTYTVCADDQNTSHREKKRDPFVALVGSDGKIKTRRELFPPEKKQTLSTNIRLTAIIWDDKRPLALINNKVYGIGQEITKGLVVEEIHNNSVILNDNGLIVTVPLRKKLRKLMETK